MLSHICLKSETQLDKNRNAKLCLFHVIQLFMNFISEVLKKFIPLTSMLHPTYNCVQYNLFDCTEEFCQKESVCSVVVFAIYDACVEPMYSVTT